MRSDVIQRDDHLHRGGDDSFAERADQDGPRRGHDDHRARR